MVKEGKAQAVVTEGRRIQCDQVSCPSNLLITWAVGTGGSACCSGSCRATSGRGRDQLGLLLSSCACV